ncbi:MAG: hypothetical protein KDI03_05400 [Anaerolineae bacterium]|nr:hypothetical protein [Anaerolineae bacterium]
MQLSNRRWRWATRTGCILASLYLILVFVGNADATHLQTTWVVTSTDDSGPGTLRQAIADAAPGDMVVFDGGLAGATISLTSGQLEIDKDLVIDANDAPGITVSGGGRSRVFLVDADVTAELRALVIRDGKTPDAATGENSEGGGGIYSRGTLRLVACSVRANRTGNGGNGGQVERRTPELPAGNAGRGGGIMSEGDLILESTTVISNTTGHGGDSCFTCYPWWPGLGGDSGDGGGIYSSGVLTVVGSVVRDNVVGRKGVGETDGRAGDGGGIYGVGKVSITGSEVISNATASASPAGGRGGGVFAVGVTNIADSDVRNNVTGTGLEGGDGAGIYAIGSLHVADSHIELNTAGPGGQESSVVPYYGGGNGGPGGNGGGIYFGGDDLMVLRTVVASNRAGPGGPGDAGSRWGGNGGLGGNGGGILAVAGNVVLIASSVSQNSAGAGGPANCGFISCGRSGDGGSGGGIMIYSDVSVTIEDTTVSDNLAGDGGLLCDDAYQPPCPTGGDGGGISNLGALTMRNATVSGNRSGGSTAEGGRGGGVYSIGQAWLWYSTITDNEAPANAGGGLWTEETVILADTLVDANWANLSGSDCAGYVFLLNHNLVGRSEGCGLVGDPQSNIFDQPALIGPLALNAPGTTETHALLPNSPAIDAGSCDGGVATDQRGVPRPQGAECDIGAYEYDPSLVDWQPLYLPLIARR